MKPLAKITITLFVGALFFGFLSAGFSENHHDAYCVVSGIAGGVLGAAALFIGIGAALDE